MPIEKLIVLDVKACLTEEENEIGLESTFKPFTMSCFLPSISLPLRRNYFF